MQERPFIKTWSDFAVPQLSHWNPFRSYRREYLLLPAASCQKLECFPVNSRSKGVEELSSLPMLPLLLAKVWILAGAPRLCTVCSWRWGIPLTSNYQFLYTREDIFWHRLSFSLHVWLTAPLLIYFFGIFYAFVKMSNGTHRPLEWRLSLHPGACSKYGMLEVLFGIEVIVLGK